MKHVIPAVLGLALALGAQNPTMETERLVDRDFILLDALSEHCFRCHGPEKQKSGLRLDEEDGLLSVIEPGDPALSELIRRLLLPKANDEAMPPPPADSMQRQQPGFSREETWAAIEWVRDGAETERMLELLAERRAREAQDNEAIRQLSEQLGAHLTDMGNGLRVDFRFGRGALDAPAGTAIQPLAGRITELNFAGREPSIGFLESLPVLPRLSVLRAERSGLSDESLSTLLAKTPALQEANLHSTRAGNAVVSAAFGIPTLTRIIAFDTRITRADLAVANGRRQDLEWVLGDRHPEKLFPGGGPRHLLVADAAKDRLVLLIERALTHYDEIASWPLGKVVALDDTNGQLFARLEDRTIRRLDRVGDQWAWVPSDGPSEFDSRPLDQKQIQALWSTRPKSLQTEASRTFVRLLGDRILVSQLADGAPALIELDMRGVKRWSLHDPERFPKGVRTALALDGDPRQ